LRVANAAGEVATNRVSIAVLAVNDQPQLSVPVAVSFPEDSERLLSLEVSDADSAWSALQVAAVGSDAAMWPPGSLVVEGTGGLRTLRLRPATDQWGISTVWVVLTDPDRAVVLRAIEVNGLPLNDPPVVGLIANASTTVDQVAGPIAFTVADDETSPNALLLRAWASNPALIGEVILGGGGTERTITLVPVVGQYGWSQVMVEAQDARGLLGRRAFEVVVNQSSGPPIIVLQPESKVVPIGELVQLRVLATGPGPMEYQWEKDGLELTGARAAVLDLGLVTAEDAGVYRARVSNGAGSTVSVPATVQVYAPPRITTLARQSPGVMRLSFTTSADQFYTVEYIDSLGSGSWQILSSVTGNGGTVTVTDSAALTSSRFYRVKSTVPLPAPLPSAGR
jgi:hypothetical protein